MAVQSKTSEINIGFAYGNEWKMQEEIAQDEDLDISLISRSKFHIYSRAQGQPTQEWIWRATFRLGQEAIKYLNDEMGNNQNRIVGEVISYNQNI